MTVTRLGGRSDHPELVTKDGHLRDTDSVKMAFEHGKALRTAILQKVTVSAPKKAQKTAGMPPPFLLEFREKRGYLCFT